MLPTIARIGVFSVVFVAAARHATAETTLARIFLTEKNAKPLIGELLNETDGKITIYDIQASKVRDVPRDSIREVRRDLSEQAAASLVDLSRFLAWKIKTTVPLAPAQGHIATVDLATVYVSLGEQHGIEEGQELTVYRGAKEVRDPNTKEVLDRIRRRVGKLKVIEVRQKVSKCGHTGELEVEYQVGDEVESSIRPAIAVFPIGDASGNATGEGDAFTEQLTGGLAEAGIPLVERTRLGDTLAELALQQADLFDAKSAQRVGKQLGAVAVLVGSIEDEGKPRTANLRLTKVSTGEILLSHAAELAKGKSQDDQSPNADPRPSPGLAREGNLLAKPDVAVEFKKGNWQLQNGRLLFTGNSGDGLAVVAQELPKDFRLTLKAVPAAVTPATCIALYFQADNDEFIVQLAQDGSGVIVDGKDPRSDRSAKYDAVFVAGKPNAVTYIVRQGVLTVAVNGRAFLRHRDARLGKSSSPTFTLGVVGDWSIDEIRIARP